MNVLQLFTTIRTFVFDVDGVMTDGSLLLTEQGDILRTMNIKDGYALQLAIKKGYGIIVISGGSSEAVRHRLAKLGIHEIFTGIDHKKEVMLQRLRELNADPATVLYMGDDVPDYAPMLLCGLPCCPNDAVPEIKSISKYISPYHGGHGCVRDVIEKVLKLNGHWEL